MIRWPESAPRRPGGWTLIEIILAVTLGSTVVAASATVVVETAAARGAVRAELARQNEQNLVFQQFEQDVESRLRDLSSETPVVLVAPGTLMEVLCLAHAPAENSPFSKRLPAKVTYAVNSEKGEVGGRKQLVRTARFLTDPLRTAHSISLATDLEEVHVDYLVGDQWKVTLTDDELQRIRAVRLACRWDDNDPLRRTVVLDQQRSPK